MTINGVSLNNLPTQYLYLMKLNHNGDNVLDGNDDSIFDGLSSPEEADAALIANRHVPRIYELVKNSLIFTHTLPPGHHQESVEVVDDADTIIIPKDYDHDGKHDSVRTQSANALEVGHDYTQPMQTPEIRVAKAEQGALEASDAYERLIMAAGSKVYIGDPKIIEESYKRILSVVYGKIGSAYMDFAAQLLFEGHMQVFDVKVKDWLLSSSYNFLQRLAQADRKGIWNLPNMSNPNNPDEIRDFKNTSFHPYPRATSAEYLRLAANRTFNLASYRFVNPMTGEIIELQDYEVPGGRTVKFFTTWQWGESNFDQEKEFVYSNGLTLPFWQPLNACGVCLEIQTTDGQVIETGNCPEW